MIQDSCTCLYILEGLLFLRDFVYHYIKDHLLHFYYFCLFKLIDHLVIKSFFKILYFQTDDLLRDIELLYFIYKLPKLFLGPIYPNVKHSIGLSHFD